MRGITHNVDVSQYGVAVYINVFGTWWTKPSWAVPMTPINSDGTFVTHIVTGGQDACAQEVAAYVVPLGYAVPLGTGQSSIPHEIETNSIAKLVANKTQSEKPILFSGRSWIPKDTSTCVWGPGPNYFTRTNAAVDSQGRLHLQVSYTNGVWRCAEVMLTNSLGYGTYRVYLDNDISNIPPQLVFGFFTWSDDSEYTHREIDVEFSNGNVIGWPDSWQYVVQPYGLAGHRFRFPEPSNMTNSTHSFAWVPGKVWFASYARHVPDCKTFIIQVSKDLSGWSEAARVNVTNPTNVIVTVQTTNSPYQFYRAVQTLPSGVPAPLQTIAMTDGVPPAGKEGVHINLWLDSGHAPDGTTNELYEIIVSKFEFLPVVRPQLKIVGVSEQATQVLLQYGP